MHLPLLKSATVSHKRVLLRLDLDVPVENGKIIDATRLEDGLPTIQYLSDHGAIVIVVGHLGRPDGVDTSLSLEPIAKWLAQKLAGRVVAEEMHGFSGFKINENVFLLENIRFFKEEE